MMKNFTFIPILFWFIIFAKPFHLNAQEYDLNTFIRKSFANQQFSNDLLKQNILNNVFIKDNNLEIYLNLKRDEINTTLIENTLEEILPSRTIFHFEKVNFYFFENNVWLNLNKINFEAPQILYKNPSNNDNAKNIEGDLEKTGGMPSSGQGSSSGALNGKTVWLSPGHGWFNDDGGAWTTQRGTTNGMVEDFGSVEGIDYYLQHYLKNAGANVWSVRERDVQRQEIIVDNDAGAPSYTETGIWANGSVAGYGGTYRTVNTASTETATAIFKPNITVSGAYWVSVRFIAGTNRTISATYKINHAGGTSTHNVNQEIHGDTWIYLGQYYFMAGSSTNNVTISNISSDVGQALIADAVRFGGGLGTLPDCTYTSDGISGKTKYDEAARQYAMFQGYPTCRNDVTMRPFYAEWELAKGTATEQANAVYVSWHTNAFDGTARGTTVYSYDGTGIPPITPGSPELRNYIHNTLIADIRAQWDPAWQNRGVNTANFGELRELTTMPGCLAEMAFHDNATDASFIKNPEFKKTLARAVYKGIVKFFNNRDGSPLQILPETPTHVRVVKNGAHSVLLSWNTPPNSTNNVAYGDAATGYKYYISQNGKGFADGIVASGNSVTISGLDSSKIYYFRVAATNSGGESFPSSVVACKIGATGYGRYLIVDGFDRLDASLNVDQYESAALGTVKRNFIERMNRYDYMIEHAEGLTNCTPLLGFDGATNESIISADIILGNYQSVDWFTGEESTADKTFDATEQNLIKTYLDNGGNILVSGSEIGWDIGRAASSNASVPFFNNYFRANYVGDDANTYDFSGSGIFSGITGSFNPDNIYSYNNEFPDRISAYSADAAGTYTGGTADGAAVSYSGTFKSVYFGFPIDMINNTSTRNDIFCKVVTFFSPSLLGVDWSVLNGKSNDGENQLTLTNFNEENIKQIQIQKSQNGTDFTGFENILPQNKEGKNMYSILDKNPFAKTFYRALITDIDGKTSFSNIIQIHDKNILNVFIYPNPVQNNLIIQVLEELNDDFEIECFTLSGQLLFKNKYNPFEKSILINFDKYTKGTYIIQIKTQSKTLNKKIFKN